jgi:integrase
MKRSAMIAKPAYPYLCRDADRHGRVRYRLRAPGRKAVTIKGHFGSEEFAANYRAAVEGLASIEKRGIAAPHGSMAALARSYLRSAAFAGLSPATQRARRHLVEQFIAKYGDCIVAELERRHIRAIMDAHAGTPGKARNVLSMIRVLIASALVDGIIATDPTIGIKRPKLSREGWHTWTEEEIAIYEARHPVGTMARLAFALALYTGQRSADLIRMGKQHVRDGMIRVVQQKTGTPLWIPLHPNLKAIIDATPSRHLTFLLSEKGKPYGSANSFGQIVKRWARQAGLRGTPLHGLRKACCTRLAENGRSAREIMAISGHKSLAEVERYTRATEQKLLADRAIQRTVSTHTATPNYPRERKT